MNVKRQSVNKPRDVRPLSMEEVCVIEKCSPPLLSTGNRVVWLSDNGPEFGYIKWLGKLPDVGSDWMAGVHFDNPVGSGTGVYNDYQLFEAPIHHASLVPVIGLLKAEDFLGSSEESPSRTTSKSSSLPSTNRSEPSARPRRNQHHEFHESDKLIDLTPVVEENSNRSRVIYHDIVCETDSSPYKIMPKPCSETSDLSRKYDGTDYRNTHSSNYYSPSSHKVLEKPLKQDIACHHANSMNKQQPKPWESHLPALKYAESESKSKFSELEKQNNLESVANGMHTVDEMDIGSLVEITIDDLPKYGVIKWIGYIPGQSESRLVAGIELEEEHPFATDGTWKNVRYFDCAPKRGYFILLNQCRKDSRFTTLFERKLSSNSDSLRITCDIPPLSTLEDLKFLCGKRRGIQGHHNSCYLDATLFAMFSCTTIFESLLHRPQGPHDIPEYSEVQRVLKEEIVNPLRANFYVSADRVMHLRTLLEKLTSVRGLTSEEKDPEEFLNLLLNEVLKAEPYLKLSSGLESYFYQLFVEKDEKLILPTVQQLFDQSFLASDFKLREIPPCLLLQMPRFGRQFKMYSRIIPSLYLDITDVLENSPRQCSICGQLAEHECKECFGQFGEGLDSTAFCQKCLDKSHGHKKRSKHKTVPLAIPQEFSMLKEHTQIQRIYMELFAVLCIETSHYVCFVKCGSGPDAPWCFFDSMADRNGEQDGYNIPEVIPFPNLRWWLSDEGNALLLTTKDDKLLPEMARRLLCDAYMCIYQSPDLMMYR